MYTNDFFFLTNHTMPLLRYSSFAAVRNDPGLIDLGSFLMYVFALDDIVCHVDDRALPVPQPYPKGKVVYHLTFPSCPNLVYMTRENGIGLDDLELKRHFNAYTMNKKKKGIIHVDGKWITYYID